jgi:hypothetical protein
MFARYLLNRIRRTQHGVPRGAVFSAIDALPGQERGARAFKTAGGQQVDTCRPDGGGCDLRAQIDGKACCVYQPEFIGNKRRILNGCGKGTPFGHLRQIRTYTKV